MLFLIPLLINSHHNRTDQRQIHPRRHFHPIRLVPAEHLPHIHEFPPDLGHDPSVPGDVGGAVEELTPDFELYRRRLPSCAWTACGGGCEVRECYI